MILFQVTRPSNTNPTFGGVSFRSQHVVIYADGRDYAAARAQRYLGGRPEDFIVTPLTADDDTVYFELTVNP